MLQKGQGTTEYLIILAIVIVIALVVVNVLGIFPSFAGGVSASASKAYWGGTSPLALVEWSVPSGSGTASFVFQNLTSGTITVTDLNWNGTLVNITDANVGAGSKATVTDTTIACGAGAGQQYSKTFGYTYNTQNLSGLKFTGVTPLVGSCQ